MGEFDQYALKKTSVYKASSTNAVTASNEDADRGYWRTQVPMRLFIRTEMYLQLAAICLPHNVSVM